MQSYTITTTSSDQTQRFGRQLGQHLKSICQPQAGAFVIALHGDLGAGKTTLTQGIAAGLGVTQSVTSPTYTLINEYALAANLLLAHVDSYRLADSAPNKAEAAALGIGLDELLDDDQTILIIEWASYLADLLPADHLAITLQAEPDNLETRQIHCQATGPRSQALLADIAAPTS